MKTVLIGAEVTMSLLKAVRNNFALIGARVDYPLLKVEQNNFTLIGARVREALLKVEPHNAVEKHVTKSHLEVEVPGALLKIKNK